MDDQENSGAQPVPDAEAVSGAEAWDSTPAVEDALPGAFPAAGNVSSAVPTEEPAVSVPVESATEESEMSPAASKSVGSFPVGNDSGEADQEGASTEVPQEDVPSEGATNPVSMAEVTGRLADIVAGMQALAERMGAIEAAFPILRKDVLGLSKAVSGLYTTTTDRMHAKLEKYDRGLEQSIAKPYLRAIAKIGDALRQAIKAAEVEPDSAIKQLRSLQDDVRIPLWNEGLRPIEIQPGTTPFNPRLHDGRDIVPIGDKALDGIIESVVETGYVFAPETDDPGARPRVFRAALVRVFRYDSSLEAPTEEPTI